MPDSNTRKLCLEAVTIFAAAMAFLFALAPTAPFTKELGVCESGAVRDVLAGNVILPHFVPGPIVHVPPLYWWTAALCVRWLGWDELALRLPSLVPAALTCAIVFAWVAATIGRRAALWAASSLLFCHFFVDAARQPRMDSMLALFVTAAAVCLERAIHQLRQQLQMIKTRSRRPSQAMIPHPLLSSSRSPPSRWVWAFSVRACSEFFCPASH